MDHAYAELRRPARQAVLVAQAGADGDFPLVCRHGRTPMGDAERVPEERMSFAREKY